MDMKMDAPFRLGVTKLYVDGELRAAAGGATYDNISPWTGDIVGKAADASATDVSDAVAAARKAFDTTDWSTNHAMRLQLLKRLYELFCANTDRLIQMARDEAGSTIFIARHVQILQALAGYKDLLDAFDKVEWTRDRGARGPEGRVSQRIQRREAVGVVGAITPFNVPFYVNIEKTVSALLAGCTVVLKPAPDTPALGAIWGEMALEAGFPPGVLNVVTGADPRLGEMLVLDPRVDVIAFTGSSAVGKRIMEKAARTLKRVLLELGGKSAKIILDDVEDFAAEVRASMVAGHSGQGCTTRSRLLVPRSRYAEAVEILKAAYASYDGKWGHYDDLQDPMGPVISQRQMERIKADIDAGINEGARLIAGGRISSTKGGFFIEPTCFVDVTNDMKIAREEVFGPVLVVMSYADEDDAVRITNDSEYGLSGEVSSSNVERALKLAARFRSGTVSINGGRCVDGDIPFGGYKSSGLGRAWGVEGIEAYTETKIVAYLQKPSMAGKAPSAGPGATSSGGQSKAEDGVRRTLVPGRRCFSEELAPGVRHERFWPGGKSGPNGEVLKQTLGGQVWSDNFLLGDQGDAFQMLVPDIRLPANQYWPLHWHDCWTAVIVLEGQCLIGDWKMEPGDVFLAEPSVEYGPLLIGPDGVRLFEVFARAHLAPGGYAPEYRDHPTLQGGNAVFAERSALNERNHARQVLPIAGASGIAKSKLSCGAQWDLGERNDPDRGLLSYKCLPAGARWEQRTDQEWRAVMVMGGSAQVAGRTMTKDDYVIARSHAAMPDIVAGVNGALILEARRTARGL